MLANTTSRHTLFTLTYTRRGRVASVGYLNVNLAHFLLRFSCDRTVNSEQEQIDYNHIINNNFTVYSNTSVVVDWDKNCVAIKFNLILRTHQSVSQFVKNREPSRSNKFNDLKLLEKYRKLFGIIFLEIELGQGLIIWKGQG